MSTVKDALVALKKVIMVQERLERMQQDINIMANDMSGMKDFSHQLDKRVVRIETMIEMSGMRGARQPRIEP